MKRLVSDMSARRVAGAAGALLLGALLGPVAGRGAGTVPAAAQVPERPVVSKPVSPAALQLDLRNLPRAEPARPGDPVGESRGQRPPGEEEIEAPEIEAPEIEAPEIEAPEEDGAAAGGGAPVATSVGQAPSVSLASGGFSTPIVNALFAIFDKTGALLVGPSFLNALWAAAAGQVDPADPCVVNNDGDPIVLYDHLADRWLLSQFVAFTNQCIAVSATADPIAGGWFLMGTNAGYPAGHAWAFDRAAMLAGAAATFQRFPGAGALPTFVLPSDLDGPPPPAGAPNVFLRFVDGAEFGGADRLELWEFHVDFANPGLSTFTLVSSVPTAPFDSNLCGFGFRPQCVPQPGTTQLLDTLRGEPMYRLQDRNVDAYETLVVNHTVDADGADRAGIRWYELRKVGGAWSVFQEGTHAPDDTHRWMASIAMDRGGNIALGYSVSSATVFPGIRYAGRLAGDPAGALPQGEFSLIEGGSAQTGGAARRWGDYSAMALDPADGCTFWFTTEYYAADSPSWRTRIGSFRLPECPIPVAIDIKPGSFPNSVKLRNRGVVPVAILSTAEFDATTVDAATVCFGDAQAPAERDCTEALGRGHLEDVSGDGNLDVVLHYETAQTGIDAGDTEACPSGTTVDGQAFDGCDSVRTR